MSTTRSVRRSVRTFTVITGAVVLAIAAPKVLSAAPWHRDVSTVRGGSPADWLDAGRAVDAGALDPGLEAALARARERASHDGIDLPVASGYRSAEEQAALLAQEIEERGDLEEALWWVFPPHVSMHVRGLAIDVDSGPGADWLVEHGAAFGLCRSLAWEWWHFEWRRAWEQDGACPPSAATPDAAPPA